MLRFTVSNAVVAILVYFNATIGIGADNQTWSVTIVDDTAILRSAPKIEMKYILSTLTELQSSGIGKLTLSAEPPLSLLGDAKRTYTVSIVDGLGQILATSDLPSQYIKLARKSLGSAGVKFVNVARP